MPHWFIVTLVILLVAPGAAIILFGVFALFRAPEPAAPTAPPEGADASEPDPPASFSASPVPPLTIDAVDESTGGLIDDVMPPGGDPIIDAEVEPASPDPMLPPPQQQGESDVT